MRGWLRIEIPEESKPLWAYCVLQVLDLIIGDKDKERAWALLMSMQFLLLQRPGKIRSKGTITRIVHNRMLRFVKWNIKELLEEAEQQYWENQEILNAKPVEKGEVAPRSGETQRSRRLFMDGRLSDSLKEIMLNGGGVRRSPTEATELLLKEKIAASEQNMPGAVDSLSAWRKIQGVAGYERIIMTEIDFAKLFGDTDKCRGPGLSGMTYGQMNDALKASETRQRVLRGYAAIITLLINGELPKSLWPYWFGGKAGIAGKDGRRLFVAGESLQKLAERFTIRKVLAKKKFFKFNVGVGFSGAADYIASWAAKIRADHKEKMGLVFVEVDAANMFLELVRMEVMILVKERAPELFPFVMHLTGPMFISLFQGKQLEEVMKGISIGSSASSFIASLVGEVLLENVQKECVADSIWSEFLAFIDNIFIATTVDKVHKVLAHLGDMGKKYGLIYEIRKEHPHKICFVNVGKRNQGQMSEDVVKKNAVRFKGFDVSAMWKKEDIEASAQMSADFPPSKRGLVLAGVPVGTEEFHEAEWDRKMLKVKQLVTVLEQSVHPKEAIILLRKCVALRMGFQVRMADEVSNAIRRAHGFDDMLLRAVQTIVEGSGDWAAEKTKRLWLLATWKLGGLEYSVVPAKLAAAASVSENGHKMDQISITHLYGLFNSRVVLGDQLVFKKRDQMLSELKTLGPKVQKVLTERILRAKRVELLNRLPEGGRDIILLEEVSRKDANLWRDQPSYSSVLPPRETERQSLDPDEFRYAVRRRMPGSNPQGLPASLLMGEGIQCSARSSNGNICMARVKEGICDHPEVLCPTIKGAGKHSCLLSCACDIARDLGLTAVVTKLEPRGLVGVQGARKHADVRISGLQRAVPTVVDVANKSRFATGARSAYMEQGEKKKVADYAERYAEGGERFIPFLTGGHGGFGDRAWELVRMLAQRLLAIQGIPVLKGEVVVKALFQCRVEKQIALNGERFFKRHEGLINVEAMKESDAARQKAEEKARKEEHAKQNAAHDAALDKMVEDAKVNARLKGLPPMVGDGSAAAAVTKASAKPPQARAGPAALVKVTSEAAVQIKLIKEMAAKAPKGMGLGALSLL